MKKYIFISGAVAFAVAGVIFYSLYRPTPPCCDVPVVNENNVTEKDSQPSADYIFSEKNNYEEETTGATRQVALEKTAVYDMNDYLGFPKGNTLKTHSVCYDESIGQGYIAGILTSEVAVFKNDKVFAYVDTGMGVGDFLLKELYCGGGEVLVVSDNETVKIDGATLEVSDSVSFDPSVHVKSVYMSADFGLVAFAIPDTKSYVFYDLDTMKEAGEISIDRGKMFYKKDGTILMVDALSNTKGYEVKTIGQDFLEKDSYTIESKPETIDMDYDEANNDLWVLVRGGKILIFDLDDYEKKPFVIKTEVPDPKAIVFDPDYTVVMTENGYDEDGYGDFLGGIAILDTQAREVSKIVRIPSHHTSIELDPAAHMAYITNNGDNSVSRVNLVTGEIEAIIKAGSSTESGAVASDGSLYLRNRLGGNSIMHLNPATGVFSNIACAYPWPVGIAYSLSLNKIFTFDFLNSSISAINPETDEIEAVYNLPVPDGSTDAVGDMTYDNTRNVAYVAIPEQNVVVAVDLVTGETIQVVEVEDYLTEGTYGELGGPGELVVATYEPTAKLFVYAKQVSQIFVYDGLNDFALVGTINVSKTGNEKENFPYALVVDQAHDRLYIGSNIYDAKTYAWVGSLAYGESVAWADWEDDILFTVSVNEKANDQETLYALNNQGELLDQIDLAEGQYVKARFVHDDARGVMYVLYMVDSKVWEIKVFAQ